MRSRRPTSDPLRAEMVTLLSATINSAGTDQFWNELGNFLLSQVIFDQAGATEYRTGEPPRRVFDTVKTIERHDLLAEFSRSLYVLSPYYNNVVRARVSGKFYTINDVAPDSFLSTDYYRIFFSQKNVVDEGLYNIIFGWGCVVFMLERLAPLPPFSPADCHQLNLLAPFVQAAIASHYSETGEDTSNRKAIPLVDVEATRFADVELTARERQVAEYILRGYSSKSAARALGISPETERSHRKRLYRKLDISSHSELFRLFLASVDQGHDSPEGWGLKS